MWCDGVPTRGIDVLSDEYIGWILEVADTVSWCEELTDENEVIHLQYRAVIRRTVVTNVSTEVPVYSRQ